MQRENFHSEKINWPSYFNESRSGKCFQTFLPKFHLCLDRFSYDNFVFEMIYVPYTNNFQIQKTIFGKLWLPGLLLKQCQLSSFVNWSLSVKSFQLLNASHIKLYSQFFFKDILFCLKTPGKKYMPRSYDVNILSNSLTIMRKTYIQIKYIQVIFLNGFVVSSFFSPCAFLSFQNSSFKTEWTITYNLPTSLF